MDVKQCTQRLRARHRAATSLALITVVTSCAAVVTSCGGGQGASSRPVAALASSHASQAELRALRGRWQKAPRSERAALDADLAAFASRHAADDASRVADMWRALIALDASRLEDAEHLALRLESGKSGTVRDVALVVRGAALRRRGMPDEALAILRPLLHKVIDGDARAVLDEELTLAAIDAKRWGEALAVMTSWLRESDDRDATRARIGGLLARVPAEQLTLYLGRAGGPDAGSDGGVAELSARLLARLAQERRDASLARHLLASAGTLLGGEGDAVAKLAAGAGAVRVAGPTVGLLLSLRADESRRRGAEVAAGMAHGLGLPGSVARLVSRDDGGSLDRVTEALESLSADGAAVIVAGFDPKEAAIAAGFAETQQIPVLLLSPPEGRPALSSSGFVFVLGQDDQELKSALTDALSRAGVTRVEVLAGAADGVAAGPEASTLRLACGADLPPGLGQGRAPDGLVLLGPPACADEAVAVVRSGRLALRLAAGLDTVGVTLPAGTLVAQAGAYPMGAARAGRGASVDAWVAAHDAPPSFWAGLGHDAGVLAWAGVRSLPGRTTEDPAEVKAWHAEAREALATAQAPLWTTAARGFGGGRTIERRVTAIEPR